MRTSNRGLPSSVFTEEKPSLRPPGPAKRSMTGIVLNRVINSCFLLNRPFQRVDEEAFLTSEKDYEARYRSMQTCNKIVRYYHVGVFVRARYQSLLQLKNGAVRSANALNFLKAVRSSGTAHGDPIRGKSSKIRRTRSRSFQRASALERQRSSRRDQAWPQALAAWPHSRREIVHV